MPQASRQQCLGDMVILRDRLSDTKLRLELQSKSASPIYARIKMQGKIENKKYRSATFERMIDADIIDLEKGGVQINPAGAVEYIIKVKRKHPGEIVPVIVTYIVNGIEKKANFTFNTHSGLVWSFHGTYSI